MTPPRLPAAIHGEIDGTGVSAVPPIFGYVITSGEAAAVSARTHGDVRRMTPPGAGGRSGFALFASSRAGVRVAESAAHQSQIYLWGQPSHRAVRRANLPEWCAAVVARQQFDRFRELLGTFVMLVDEPAQGRVTMVTDVLGIRPLFTCRRPDGLVFGSSIWALSDAGLVEPSIDYDAVSAWVAYGFNCTNGSLFDGVRRAPPGAAVVVETGRTTTVTYAACAIGTRPRTAEQAADDIHDIVSSDVETLLSEEPGVVVPLSGGYDSRYLLALSAGRSTRIENVVNVRFSPAEGDIAARVAEALGVRLDTVRIDGSVWDLYDDVHHFTPDGFPISKFVTFCLARRHPSVPMLNGVLGDSLVRGSNDRFAGNDEDACGSNRAAVLQQKHLAISLNLFRPELASRILERARTPMSDAVARSGQQVFGWADLYLRQRYYIANNFLQHLDAAEAVLPFYSWQLIAYKLAHTRQAFSRRTYRHIFERHFPQLAAVPHASDVTDGTPRAAVAACTVRWARELLVQLVRPGALRAMSMPHCLSLIGLGAARLPGWNQHLAATVEDAVFTCRRLFLLEQRLERAGIAVDWDAM